MEEKTFPEKPIATPTEGIAVSEEPKKNYLKIFIFFLIGLVVLSGAIYAGYWFGTRKLTGKAPKQISTPTLPTETPLPPERLREQRPYGIALIEENALKIFTIEGVQVKSVPLIDGAGQGSSEIRVSPDGQKIALFGLPKGLVGKYKFGGGAAVPQDIFIYDRISDRLTRVTDCAEFDPGAVGKGEVDLCYTDFDWGPDSDTYAYTYMGKSQEDSYVGIGKVSTGIKNKIYSPGYMPKFSPSGQKLFVSDTSKSHTPKETFSLIDKNGSLIKEFGVDDFPIQTVVNKEKTHIYPMWGQNDNEAFLIVVETKKHQPMARNYAVLVYAFNSNKPSELTNVTPVSQKGSYSGVLDVDRVTGNIVVQHFFSPMEMTNKSVSVFSEKGKLVAQDITTSIGSEKAIAYGIHNGFVSVGADNGLWIISLSDEEPVKISSRPYVKGYIIP